MDNLVIVESPTKARTLSRFLDNKFRIEATMGHIRDLPAKKLGIKIEKDTKGYEFKPEYLIIPDRKKRVGELKDLALSAKNIILATDPDREGEAIAYHTQHVMNSSLSGKNIKPKFTRIVFHEITPGAIKTALEHPRSIDLQLVDAQQTRRLLDRLVGYKLSPLLWNKLGKRWLSAGRVQSVAVRLIVEREREIAAFKPQEYWIIEVKVSKKDNSAADFIVRLATIDGKKADLKNSSSAEAIVAELKTANYRIFDLVNREVVKRAPPPFTTSTLQQAASNRFGWSAKKTMKTAQNLYEEGLISYHRTDSTNMAVEAVNMVRGYIHNLFGDKYLPVQPVFYKTKSKVAQEAHEAIRPTNMLITASRDYKAIPPQQQTQQHLKIFNENMGRDADLLYGLIWRRFLACQMKEAIFDQTNVSVSAREKYLFKTVGERMKFPGWLTVYERIKSMDKDEDGNANEDKNILPPLSIGEELNLKEVLPQQKFTEPPARYTEATLIKTLEDKGIGRPSTYAPIISTIQDRKYVEKLDKKFHPTDLGFAVNDFLIEHFPEVFDIGFTARMEDELDSVANGEIKWQKVISEFYIPFENKIEDTFKTAKSVRIDFGQTEEKCPQCGNQLVYRMSKYGKFLACSGFPNCKYTKNVVEKIDIPCPKCGGDIVVKRTRKGKHFYGCANFPKCTFAAWKKEDINKTQNPAPIPSESNAKVA